MYVYVNQTADLLPLPIPKLLVGFYTRARSAVGLCSGKMKVNASAVRRSGTVEQWPVGGLRRTTLVLKVK